MSASETPLTPAQVLRLTDAGDAKPAWITVLTTEHYNLQTQRAATISEANGRASVFLGSVSAGLIALGFQGVGHGRSMGTTVFEVVVLSSLLFLGLVSFLRCLEIAIDDWEFTARIGHVRAAYAQLIPELAGLLATSWGEEKLTMMLNGRWEPLRKMLSVAGSIAVITSVILGADVGCAPLRLPSALVRGPGRRRRRRDRHGDSQRHVSMVAVVQGLAGPHTARDVTQRAETLRGVRQFQLDLAGRDTR